MAIVYTPGFEQHRNAFGFPALSYETPNRVYRTGVGGGALIVDKFNDDEQEQESRSVTGQRRAAAEVEMDTA